MTADALLRWMRGHRIAQDACSRCGRTNVVYFRDHIDAAAFARARATVDEHGGEGAASRPPRRHRATTRGPSEGRPMTAEPTTEAGRWLAAFLRGLLPETTQFDKQIAAIEADAVAAERRRIAEAVP